MLQVTPRQMEALTAEAELGYAERLARSLSGQRLVTSDWCRALLSEARNKGIQSERDVARLARLALSVPKDFFQAPSSLDILQSARSGALKVMQLERLAQQVIS